MNANTTTTVTTSVASDPSLPHRRSLLAGLAAMVPVAALSTLLRDPAPLYVVTAPARLRKLRRFGGRLIALYADRRSVLLAAGASRADQIRSDGGQHRGGAS